ncbi:hypothetical protein DXT87_10190 [Arthrobacter sp. AET 35A]|nr:hypothetical protein [Arthrobacter sp. AET 35A]
MDMAGGIILRAGGRLRDFTGVRALRDFWGTGSDHQEADGKGSHPSNPVRAWDENLGVRHGDNPLESQK